MVTQKMVSNLFFRVAMYFIFLCNCCCMEGYIEVMYHLYNATKQQHVFLLGDVHKGDPHLLQRRDIIRVAQNLQATVIVEDMMCCAKMPEVQCNDYVSFNYPCDQPILADILRDPLSFNPNKDYIELDAWINKEGQSLLRGMTHWCYIHAVPVVNIEFRLAEGMSFMNYPVAGHALNRLFRKIIGEINSYNDGVIFNNFYKNVVEDFLAESKQEWFKEIWDQDCTLFRSVELFGRKYRTVVQALWALGQFKEIRNKLSSDKTDCAWQKILQYARASNDHELMAGLGTLIFSKFLDARLLHEISSRNNTLMVCAGSDHIESIVSLLFRGGYKPLDRCCTKEMACALDINEFFKMIFSPQTQAKCSFHLCSGQRVLHRTLLENALASKNLRAIALLINERNSQGRTALMRAALSGDKASVIELFNLGARTDFRDNNGNTALLLALKAKQRNDDIIRLLTRIMPRSAVNVADYKYRTPLMFAVAGRCSVNMVHDLINNGAHVDSCDDNLSCVMHYACHKDCCLDVIRALVARGADVNHEDLEGHTPLMRAFKSRNYPLVKLLCPLGGTDNKVIDQSITLARLVEI